MQRKSTEQFYLADSQVWLKWRDQNVKTSHASVAKETLFYCGFSVSVAPPGQDEVKIVSGRRDELIR